MAESQTTGHNQAVHDALVPKLNAALAEAGLGDYKISLLHLTPAEDAIPQAGCHMEKMANGQWILVC